MDNLGFEPTENRVLATITKKHDNGDIEGFVVAKGPDTTIDIKDSVYIENGEYDLMTIRGYKCFLFKESALYS